MRIGTVMTDDIKMYILAVSLPWKNKFKPQEITTTLKTARPRAAKKYQCLLLMFTPSFQARLPQQD